MHVTWLSVVGAENVCRNVMLAALLLVGETKSIQSETCHTDTDRSTWPYIQLSLSAFLSIVFFPIRHFSHPSFAAPLACGIQAARSIGLRCLGHWHLLQSRSRSALGQRCRWGGLEWSRYSFATSSRSSRRGERRRSINNCTSDALVSLSMTQATSCRTARMTCHQPPHHQRYRRADSSCQERRSQQGSSRANC